MSELNPWPDPPVTHLPLCPVLMYQDKFCGRPLHSAPQHDAIPVCLMHSLDPAKDATQFQQEIDSVLLKAATSGGIADFTRFVFPATHYTVQVFQSKCIFSRARFLAGADFYMAEFESEAEFRYAVFDDKTLFTGAKFHKKADFDNTRFKADADFSRCSIRGEATFIESVFHESARFNESTFFGVTQFGSTEFQGGAVFATATFRRTANFGNVVFSKEAYFSRAVFKEYAEFLWAKFTLDAHFVGTAFLKQVNFSQAIFLAAVEFRETRFREDKESLPGPVFTLTQFMSPEKVFFYKNYLGQALFYNSDVSRLTFSSVLWRTRPNDKRQLFEECVDFEAAADLAAASNDPNERDYGLIAETYQQLKKNYDGRMDYWTAGDFHYGEMEMKRLFSPRKNKTVRWLHSNLGLVAWYRYASEYGESYVRPLLALATVLVLFTLLFPIPGMVFTKPDSPSTPPAFPVLNYSDFPAYIHSYNGPAWIAVLAFFGHSLMTALSVAGFQKELIYQPAYPWGRALALFELLLTSTLIGLFLLALRRQFRR